MFIHGSGEYTTEWIENGLMVDIAEKEGAALVTFDHRFFGENTPTAYVVF